MTVPTTRPVETTIALLPASPVTSCAAAVRNAERYLIELNAFVRRALRVSHEWHVLPRSVTITKTAPIMRRAIG